MLSKEIKIRLLSRFDEITTENAVVRLLEWFDDEEHLDEAIDFLRAHGVGVAVSYEYEQKRKERERQRELNEKRALNNGTLLNKKAYTILQDFIKNHKASGTFLAEEYTRLFKPLNLDDDQSREVWCAIRDAGIKQVFEEFKSQPYDPKSRVRYSIHAAGVSHEDRQKIISKLKTDQDLKFIPEPNNKFDDNAVRIETSDGKVVGYVSKEYNQYIFKNLIEKSAEYNPKVYRVIGGTDGKKYGLIITLFVIRLKDGANISIKNDSVKELSVPKKSQSISLAEEYDDECSEDSTSDYGYLDDYRSQDPSSLLKHISHINEDDYDANDWDDNFDISDNDY